MHSKCKLIYFLLLLSPFDVYMSESEEADSMLEKANQLFDATLYPEAAAAYESLYHDHLSDNLQLRLAYSFFMSDSYEKAINVLSINQSPLGDESWYLLGICYNRMGKYMQALEALSKYCEGSNLKNSQSAEFERGLAYFSMGSSTQAEKSFKKVTYHEENAAPYYLSQIYLARLNIKEGKYKVGDRILREFQGKVDLDPVLKMEMFFTLGESQFQQGHYSEALALFEQSLPKQNTEHASWVPEILYHLGNCCLKIAEQEQNPTAQKAEMFAKAEMYFTQLLEKEKSDRARLALGSCYLQQVKTFGEKRYYQQAVNLLGNTDQYCSRENALLGLLQLAQEASTYEERDQWYRQLSQKLLPQHPLYIQSWVLLAMNDLEHGKSLKASLSKDSDQAFERAISSCKKALAATPSNNKDWEVLAMKIQAQAYLALEKKDNNVKALAILQDLTEKKTDLLSSLEAPDEIWYLRALALSHLAKENMEYYEEAINIVQRQIEQYPKGKFAPDANILLGTLAFQQNDYRKAEEYFMTVVKNYPESLMVPEALYWAALSVDDKERGRSLRLELFEKHSESPLAAEAFFTYYSFNEYVQGDRNALKHLQTFTEKFPYSPLVLSAHILIGMDYLRDRKTPEGKWIRKKSYTSAIASFQSVLEQFEVIYQMGLISSEDLPKYINMRYRAIIESAQANHRISDESEGAKRQIYLEYAEKILQSMVHEFDDIQNELRKFIQDSLTIHSFNEEARYLLAATYSKEGKDEQAEEVLAEMLKKYQSSKITKGYYLSRALYEEGRLAMKRKEYALALELFNNAEEAAKGDLLSIDEKLDMWIQRSYCYRESNQLEQAMLILSRVINYDAVSGMRLQAMYLRAELYELQNRLELARKQLEAIAKKGGDWGLKAKEKLGKNYVYQ